ncbi:unnamed protein product [Natator depressus]
MPDLIRSGNVSRPLQHPHNLLPQEVRDCSQDSSLDLHMAVKTANTTALQVTPQHSLMGIEVILIPHIFHSSLRLFYKRTTRNLKGKDGGSLNLFSCGERCLQRDTGHLAAGQETSGFSAIHEGIHEGMGAVWD